ncbi:MAG: hypothetical protein U5R06_06685 [candidate division KSB1 bacterium]|nr:hypothetical protein [candidate division KSB1 bacterium]
MQSNKITLFIIFHIVLIFLSPSIKAAGTNLGDLPDSLVSKLGSGHIYELVDQKLNESRYVQNSSLAKSNDTRIPVAIYFEHEPDASQIYQLKADGLKVLKDSWTGPVGAHPLGFVLALMPLDQLVPTLKTHVCTTSRCGRFKAHISK